MFFLKKNTVIFNPLEQFEINTPLWYFSNFFSNITKITADINSNLVFNQNNLYTQSGINNSDYFVYFFYFNKTDLFFLICLLLFLIILCLVLKQNMNYKYYFTLQTYNFLLIFILFLLISIKFIVFTFFFFFLFFLIDSIIQLKKKKNISLSTIEFRWYLPTLYTLEFNLINKIECYFFNYLKSTNLISYFSSILLALMVLLPLYFSLLIIYIINNFFITENKNNTIIYQLFFYFIIFCSFSFFFGFSIILIRLLFDFIEFIINSLKEKKNLSLPEKLIRIPLKIIQKIQNMVYSIEITSNVS